MKKIITALALLSVSIVFLTACASTETRPVKKFQPIYFPPVDPSTHENLPKEVTIRFQGTVRKINKIATGETPSGLIVGSRFHVKQQAVIYIDGVTEDKMGILRPGNEMTFSVERLGNIFGRALPEMSSEETQRRYRFVMRGELNYKNEYGWVYLRATRLSF